MYFRLVLKNTNNPAKDAVPFLKRLSPMKAANDQSFENITLQDLVQVVLLTRYACEAIEKAYRKLEFFSFSCVFITFYNIIDSSASPSSTILF